MPKPTFILKEPTAKSSAIVLLYTCSDGRLKYYTGESINPILWPGKLPKGSQAILNRITDTVNKTIERYKIIGDPLTKDLLRSAIDTVLGRKVKTSGRDMFEAMVEVIDKMKAGIILTPVKKKRYAAGSIKNFRFTVAVLKRFDPKLKISTTTMDTYGKFLTWCQARDFSTNYIGTRIKNWRTLGRAVGGNPIFDSAEFKQIREDTFDIYLEEAELTRIVELELTETHDLIRDWFVIGCYTGLRVSDLLKLSPQNLGEDYITIATEKTDEKVVIPIHPRVKTIIKKYHGFPPAIADQTLNRVIKEVARKAKINTSVLYTVTKGGERKDYYLKKYQMVSSHTMRRTAITSMRSMSPPVPDHIIQKITGIRSLKTLARYDKTSPDEAAKIAAGHGFFK